jgi:hypothetical protein
MPWKMRAVRELRRQEKPWMGWSLEPSLLWILRPKQLQLKIDPESRQ